MIDPSSACDNVGMAQRFADRFFVEHTGELIVSAYPASGWVSNEQYLEYVRGCKRLIDEHGPFRGWLISAPKEGPTTQQRKLFADEQGAKLKDFRRVVILTDSIVVRGMLSAIRWLADTETKTKGFGPNDAAKALSWLHEEAQFELETALKIYQTLKALAVAQAVESGARSALPPPPR